MGTSKELEDTHGTKYNDNLSVCGGAFYALNFPPTFGPNFIQQVEQTSSKRIWIFIS